MQPITVVSVNVAAPQTLLVGGQPISTGIFKQPVAGAVRVHEQGLEGDIIGNPARHGGPDQAVYLFSAEDSAWWSAHLQRDLAPGFFGENLTIDRWWPAPRVGDRLMFDGLELEISFPRIPCATLAARAGSATFLKTFVAAKRPGVYARVLRPGPIAAGARGVVQRAPAGHPTTQALFEAWHGSPRDLHVLRAALAAPIARRARDAIAGWLAAAVPDGATAARAAP
jgi:MOSC domain-containing protein YiiM